MLVAAAHGGTTTIVDFAIQSKGSSMRAGLDAWHEGGPAIDHGLTIMTSEPQHAREMADDREGVTSRAAFSAHPGVPVDDQQIFRADGARRARRLITMHEIGLPIDVLVQRAQRGLRRFTRAERPEAEAGTERAIALAEMAGVPVHGAPVGAARASSGDGRARPRPADVRRDLSAISVPQRGRPARRAGRRVEGAGPVHAAAGRRSTTTIIRGAARELRPQVARPTTARSA